MIGEMIIWTIMFRIWIPSVLLKVCFMNYEGPKITLSVRIKTCLSESTYKFQNRILRIFVAVVTTRDTKNNVLIYAQATWVA